MLRTRLTEQEMAERNRDAEWRAAWKTLHGHARPVYCPTCEDKIRWTGPTTGTCACTGAAR